MASIFNFGEEMDRAEQIYSDFLAAQEEEKKKKEEEKREKEGIDMAQLGVATTAGMAGVRPDLIGQGKDKATQIKELFGTEDEEKIDIGLPQFIERGGDWARLQGQDPTTGEETADVVQTLQQQRVEAGLPINEPLKGTRPTFDKGEEVDLELPTEEEELQDGKTALQRKYEELGLEYNYAKRKERGSILSEERFTERETKRKALNDFLDEKLANLQKGMESLYVRDNIQEKFRQFENVSKQIDERAQTSINSIDDAILRIETSKAGATTSGKLKINDLLTQRKSIEAKAMQDRQKIMQNQENLGVNALQYMDNDERIVFGRLLNNNPEINPEMRVKLSMNDNYIKKGISSLEVGLKNSGVADAEIDRIKDQLLGKKLLVNGQVQYDQDNQPVRQDGGLVVKNRYGTYEPTVDMKTFTNTLQEIGNQFSPARVEGAINEVKEIDPTKSLKDSKSSLDTYNTFREALFPDYVKEGGQKEFKDFLPEDAFKEGQIDKTELNEINEYKTAAKELLQRGVVQEPEVREEKRKISSKSQLNTELQQLTAEPKGDELKNLGRTGKVNTFRVVDNKLTLLQPEEQSEVRNDEYVIIEDELGTYLVPVGKGGLDEFLKLTQEKFFVNGQFTDEAPGLLQNQLVRNVALGITAGIIPGGKEPKVTDTKLNTILGQARDRKKKLQEKTTEKEKKGSVWDELKA